MPTLKSELSQTLVFKISALSYKPIKTTSVISGAAGSHKICDANAKVLTKQISVRARQWC